MTDSITHNSFALLIADVPSTEPYEPRIEQLRRPTPPPTPPTPRKRTDLSCLSRPVRFVANDTILLPFSQWAPRITMGTQGCAKGVAKHRTRRCLRTLCASRYILWQCGMLF